MVQKMGKVIMGVFLLLNSFYVNAQLVLKPDIEYQQPSSMLTSTAVSNGKLYGTGSFNSISKANGGLVFIDPQTGLAKEDGSVFNGTVKSVVSDGQGGFFVGGAFTINRFRNVMSLVHIDANLKYDSAWGSMADGLVEDLFIHNGTLFVAGNFQKLMGDQQAYLGAIDLTTKRLTNFRPYLNGRTYGVVANDTAVWAIGDFRIVNSVIQDCIIEIEREGGIPYTRQLKHLGMFTDIHLDGSTLYIAGHFSLLDTLKRQHLGAIDIRDKSVLPWDPKPNRMVYKLSAYNARLFVQGDFDTLSGVPRRSLGSYYMTTGLLTPLAYPLGRRESIMIAVGPFGIYTNKLMPTSQSVSHGFTLRMDNNTGQALPSSVYGSGAASYIEYVGQYLVMAGESANYGSTQVSGLAEWDMTTGKHTQFRFPTGTWVSQVESAGSEVVIAGRFTPSSGLPHASLVYYNNLNQRYSALPNLPMKGIGVVKMLNNQLLIVGSDTSLAPTNNTALALYDLATESVKWRHPFNGSVKEVHKGTDYVIVRGWFSYQGVDSLIMMNVSLNDGAIQAHMRISTLNNFNSFIANSAAVLLRNDSLYFYGYNPLGQPHSFFVMNPLFSQYITIRSYSSLGIPASRTSGLLSVNGGMMLVSPSFTGHATEKFFWSPGVLTANLDTVTFDPINPHKDIYSSVAFLKQTVNKLIVARLRDQSSPRDILFLSVYDLSRSLITTLEQSVSTVNLTLYPNPASSTIALKLNGERATSITIIDRLCRLVFTHVPTSQSDDLPIDISTLPSGIYYCKVMTSAGAVSKAFVVK